MEVMDHQLIANLKHLREICLEVATPETSCYPKVYDPVKSKLDGHCGAVASLIQGIFGGDIVTGRIKGVPHYWNRLKNGQEIDLTSCQFGGDGYDALRKGRKVKPRKLTPIRFLVFAELVLEKYK